MAGTPAFSSVATTGPTAYLVGSFETVETARVFVGDSDSPLVCGADGQTLTITNDLAADVTFEPEAGSPRSRRSRSRASPALSEGSVEVVRVYRLHTSLDDLCAVDRSKAWG